MLKKKDTTFFLSLSLSPFVLSSLTFSSLSLSLTPCRALSPPLSVAPGQTLLSFSFTFHELLFSFSQERDSPCCFLRKNEKVAVHVLFVLTLLLFSPCPLQIDRPEPPPPTPPTPYFPPSLPLPHTKPPAVFPVLPKGIFLSSHFLLCLCQVSGLSLSLSFFNSSPSSLSSKMFAWFLQFSCLK